MTVNEQDTKTISLIVQETTTTTATKATTAPKQITISDDVIKQFVQEKPKESFKDTFDYLILLIIGYVIVIGLLIFGIGALIIRGKRK